MTDLMDRFVLPAAAGRRPDWSKEVTMTTKDISSEQVELLRERVLALVPTAQASRGPRMLECPDPLPEGFHCYKFLNTNPDAAWNFWFMNLLMPDAIGGWTADILVPRSDGTLIHTSQVTEYEQVISSNYISILKRDSVSFGPVHVNKTKAKVYYRELQKLSVSVGAMVCTYAWRDGRLEPTAPYRFVSDVKLPPLLESAASTGREFSYDAYFDQLDMSDTSWIGGIYFPVCQELPDGDYQLEGGDVIAGSEVEEMMSGTRDWSQRRRAPGFYIEYSMTVDPPSTITAFCHEPYGFVYVKSCSEGSKNEIHERVFKDKKKKGWFRKKTTIKKIRDEIDITRGKCMVLVGGG